MERHSVPQNIMDVEFKLFGALTIKQFAYLAAGFLVALLLYLTEIPFVLKFFLIAFSIVMGLVLSLVKINGQQSSVWISNFILALFTTQERIWKKTAVTPEILKEARPTVQKKDVEVIRKAASSIQRSRMPLATLAAKTDPVVDKSEAERLRQIEEHFSFALKDLEQKTANVVKREVQSPKPPPKADVSVPVVNRIIVHNPVEDNLAGSVDQALLAEKQLVRTPDYTAVFKPMDTVKTNRPMASSQVKTQLLDELDQEQPVTEPQTTVSEQPAASVIGPQVTEEQQPATTPNTEEQVPVQQQQPETHEQEKEAVLTGKPNIIAGIVVDKKGNPLSQAQVLVKDVKEVLKRKIVTAKNGTFSLSTPLANGIYYIDIEAEGFKFNRFELILSGSPLPNYRFRAK